MEKENMCKNKEKKEFHLYLSSIGFEGMVMCTLVNAERFYFQDNFPKCKNRECDYGESIFWVENTCLTILVTGKKIILEIIICPKCERLINFSVL